MADGQVAQQEKGHAGSTAAARGSISKKTGQRTVVGAGTGKGGKGGTKTCVPCTILRVKQVWEQEEQPQQVGSGVQDQQRPRAFKMSEEEAKQHTLAVHMDHAHGKQCVYCKCKDCKKAWKHMMFTKKCDCAIGKVAG